MAIYRRKDRDGTRRKTFHCDFVYRGVRVSEDTGAVTATEAKQWERNKRNEIDARPVASNRPDNDMTVDEAFARFWKEHLCNSLSSERDDIAIRSALSILDGKMPLAELRTSDIASFAAERRKSVGAGTVNREITTIRAMHNYALQVWELEGLRTIAWKKVRLNEPPRIRPALEPEQVLAIIAKATPRLADVIRFAILTGLRIHEIRKLRWSNVSLDRSKITFVGKGNKAAVTPMSGSAREMLKRLDAANTSNGDKVFDFTNHRREWVAAREKAGVPTAEFHSLRHAMATLMLKAGVDKDYIKSAMRHSNTSTTEIYLHAEDPKLKAAFEAVAKIIGG